MTIIKNLIQDIVWVINYHMTEDEKKQRKDDIESMMRVYKIRQRRLERKQLRRFRRTWKGMAKVDYTLPWVRINRR